MVIEVRRCLLTVCIAVAVIAMIAVPVAGGVTQPKIAPTEAAPPYPFTIQDIDGRRLVEGSVAVFRLNGVETVIQLETHKPWNTAQGMLPAGMGGGDYEVSVRQPGGTEFVVGMFKVLTNLANQAPVLVVTPDQPQYIVDENTILTITVSFSDPDGDSVTVQASQLPAFVTASPAVPGTTSPITLTLNPSSTDAGWYGIVLIATDNDPVAPKWVFKILNILVTRTNSPGTLALSAENPPPLTIAENSVAEYKLALTDPEGDGISSVFFVSPKPDMALKAKPMNTGGGWYLHVEPDCNAAKAQNSQDYTIFVQAEDNGLPTGALSNVLPVPVTVANVNCPPMLATIGNKYVNEGDFLNFTIYGTDLDIEDTNLWFIAYPLPPGAVLKSTSENSREFYWTPGYDQAGTYNINFAVYDRDPAGGDVGLYDSEEITVTVNNICVCP
jgi:hypothetical protein